MNDPPYGLYIHVPFCLSKCIYCSFYSVTERHLIEEYLKALIIEIRKYSNTAKRIDTVYLGGGTPSVLEAGQISVIFDAIYRYYDVEDGAEITIEANPQDITRNFVRELEHLGINRVSVGIQSFFGKDLEFLHRRHTAGESFESLDILHNSGIEKINADIIWGLPGQDTGHTIENLKRAALFKPSHISAYELTYSSGTPLFEMMKAGRFSKISDHEKADIYTAVSEFLTAEGYIHYEISNFSRNTSSCSKHNKKYWDHMPYIGLGPSAHSFDMKRRWWNYPDIKKYCKTIINGNSSVEASETLTAGQIRSERIMLGFRTIEGVSLSIINRLPESRKILEDLKEQGFIRIMGEKAVPTLKGMLIADHLASLFEI